MKIKTTNQYKASVSDAIAFKHEYPEEKTTTAARIYGVNDSTLRTIQLLERRHGRAAVKRGVHNKILSEVQVEAIYKYVEDSYHSGYGATKAMVHVHSGCRADAEAFA